MKNMKNTLNLILVGLFSVLLMGCATSNSSSKLDGRMVTTLKLTPELVNDDGVIVIPMNSQLLSEMGVEFAFMEDYFVSPYDADRVEGLTPEQIVDIYAMSWDVTGLHNNYVVRIELSSEEVSEFLDGRHEVFIWYHAVDAVMVGHNQVKVVDVRDGREPLASVYRRN
ncbi:hypothetical protein A6E01_19405 (plasmid) [Vibrio breoganii]|uniref:Uncharacterized protein n=1 Tax=Vibrio breoganii TaxID=553239 RepID=A0AAN0XZE7_9VIBR|nr:hypothetical protein [Vibrio breoganii]ANO35383.1 hypothetical protein A6E01_19405 [Vibrio breoganii]PML12695.1 hypothetical protein BCT84_02100 [Vibrio breoganii]